jgi:ABC-type antimicrobial peptide transport system permease subunit
VIWTVTKEVAMLLGVGTTAGLFLSVLSVLVLRAVSAPAPGISLYRPTADPVTLIAIAAFMGAVGVAAASLPAWRAATLDPLEALRRE